MPLAHQFIQAQKFADELAEIDRAIGEALAAPIENVTTSITYLLTVAKAGAEEAVSRTTATSGADVFVGQLLGCLLDDVDLEVAQITEGLGTSAGVRPGHVPGYERSGTP